MQVAPAARLALQSPKEAALSRSAEASQSAVKAGEEVSMMVRWEQSGGSGGGAWCGGAECGGAEWGDAQRGVWGIQQCEVHDVTSSPTQLPSSPSPSYPALQVQVRPAASSRAGAGESAHAALVSQA